MRARERCEYCLLPAADAAIAHHVDHVIPLKHGGATAEANLAYACFACNLAKGTDIAAFDPADQQIVRLFNPRLDPWTVHFALHEYHIAGLDAIGRATAQLLRFNDEARVRQRQLLLAAKRYRIP
jgi:hypothetical protein